MAKKQSAKRALLLSALSLLMCVSLLIGTTFAWFTDSVTVSGNTIQSGNLLVDLVDKDGNSLEGQTLEFVDENDVVLSNILWEPGCTYTLEDVFVKNKGNLALKYYIVVSGTVGDAKLLEAIDWTIVFNNQETDLDNLTGRLAAGATSSALSIKGHMKEEAGNDYQDLTLAGISITVYATQDTVEADSFGSDYDLSAAVYVKNTAEAQAALDNATKNTVIVLAPYVNYGTLYLRPSTNTDVTKVVDWLGNNYVYETYSLFEDIVILGSKGSVVDAIEVEGVTCYQGGNTHSQVDIYPTMLSLIELRNVTIDGVTFTGNGGQYGDNHGNAISVAGGNIKVDGLTIKNCVLEDPTHNNRILYKSEATTMVHNFVYDGETYTLSPTLKDITVTGCTFNGGYQGLELRETENVTITNNTFNGVSSRDILLTTNDGCEFSGTITIKNNTSYEAKDRFVRAAGIGDATVIITDNNVIDYMAPDNKDNYIFVEGATGVVTIENNTMSRKYVVADAAELKSAIAKGGNVVLADNIVIDEVIAPYGKDTVIDGNGKTISVPRTRGTTAAGYSDIALIDVTGGSITIKNVTFEGVYGTAILRTAQGATAVIDNVTVQNCSNIGAASAQGMFRLLGDSTVTNCTFKNNDAVMVVSCGFDTNEQVHEYVFKNNVFENNVCNTTAVLYYANGAKCVIDNNKFVGNTLNLTANGATIYLGFKKNTTTTNNLFKNNTVTTTGSSSRVAGALMVGNTAVISGNAFIGNTVSGPNAVANDVCASAYYADIDLSGNYWGGSAPVENDDYYLEYTNYDVIVNDYLTTYAE